MRHLPRSPRGGPASAGRAPPCPPHPEGHVPAARAGLPDVEALLVRQQVLPALLVGRVRDDALQGADGHTLWLVEEAQALRALHGVDHVHGIALADGLVRAVLHAGPAARALLRDHERHGIFSWSVGLAASSQITSGARSW